jgi:hypothetical protein
MQAVGLQGSVAQGIALGNTTTTENIFINGATY